MTKVRHWHSKQVLDGLMAGLNIGRAIVLLSIVWDVIRPIVGREQAAAWRWSLRSSLIKVALLNFGRP